MSKPVTPINALTRAEVYDRIDGELAYAHAKWPGHRHSALEYLVYMEHYIALSKTLLSTTDDDASHDRVMDNVRKIAGLAVTAMEEHGVNPRT